MNSRNPFLPLASVLCAIPLVLSLPTASAEEADIRTLVNDSISAMNAEKWEEALALNTRAVTAFGKNNPAKIHGPKFGEIYYRKGLCELKLRKYADAVKSFEACYRDFPNVDGKPAGNRFHKMALLLQAEASVGAEQYEEALKLFDKFLKERDEDRDKYPKGKFHIAMAISNYGVGRIPEGNEHLEIAIKNRRSFPTSDNAIFSAFQHLVDAALSGENEQALLDFIEKNRSEIVSHPYQMHRYSKVLMKLAAEAIDSGMYRAAFALYQMIPATDAAIDDIRARLKLMGPLERITEGGNVYTRKNLEAELAALEEERRGKRSIEMAQLAAAAYIHEKNDNVRGAYAAYLMLETFYPTSEKREDNLYNLVRTSSLVGTTADTLKYADSFLASFPESRYLPDIRRLMLASAFFDGKYASCIEIAAPLLPTLQEGTPEHDMCLHVLGGSYYYTVEFEKAQPLLEQHVEKYPESMFALSAAYFRASNAARLGNHAKAAELLDAFLTTHSDPAENVYMPFALYDRADCHYNLDQPEAALEVIARIVRDFPNTVVIDQAYLLRGNIEESLKNYDRAEKAYNTAYQNAVKLYHEGIASEALFSLIMMLSTPELGRLKDAVPFVDEFWQKHAEGSPYRARIAMGQFPALAAVDRAEDGLKRLREIIAETASSDDTSELETLISVYADAFLTKHTAEELKTHFYNFPGIRDGDTAARALLRVYVIRVYEGLLKKAKEEADRVRIQATIKALFQELKTDFALKDLTANTLVKVGDYLRRNTSTPREALPYYDEVLGRNDKKERLPALIGRADIFGNSGVAADMDKALADFETVLNESENKAEDDFALFRIIELLFAKQEYAKVEEKALLYLDPKKSGITKPKNSPEVGMLLARSFDERKMVNDAIGMYGKIYGANPGRIRVSAPAVMRWMELLWARNEKAANPALPSDRQGAYEGGAKFIQNSSRFKDKMPEDELKLWQEVEKLVQTYEANPEIKSMRDINREKEAAQKMRIR
jgi:tetratricopeptide (TPR) repeat protein